jgi:xanthine/CO dehydrogenase XdhC/CoxF family maturation factor
MSKELRSIVEHFGALGEVRRGAVLATVIEVRGSSYRLPGARMLIDDVGHTHGTVSGGCLEADLLERAARVRQSGVAEVFVYDTTTATEDSVFGLNMGCRGVIRILLEPVTDELIAFLGHRLQSRSGGVAATLINSDVASGVGVAVGTRLLMDERGVVANGFAAEIVSQLAADCRALLADKASKLRSYDFGEVFLEHIAPPVPLVIFGAGHDAVPLIRLATELGWRVTLVDHRPAVAARAQFLAADEIIITRPESAAQAVVIDERTAVVLMTHNYEHDRQLLEFALPSPARYVGLLGPRSRADKLLQDLARTGVEPTHEQLERLHAPVGLDVGAETPEEIALSIIAEALARLSDRRGGMLRARKGGIHSHANEDTAPVIELNEGSTAVA